MRRGILGTAAALTVAMSSTAGAIAPPNDPLYPQQIQPGGALNLMRVPGALSTIGRTPLANVLVTNLDTGMDLTHPEFSGVLTTVPAGTPAPLVYGQPPTNPATVPAGGSRGWDLIGFPDQPADGSVKPDADPTDPAGHTGHGTQVAGVLGQAFNNGVGGVGVAPNARFLAMRTCWDDDDCFGSIQADAIPWAVARGTRVFSLSWLTGNAAADGSYGDGLSQAIHNASNSLFVAIPSGNGGAADTGTSPRPCGDPASNILCVSTSSPNDGLDCGGFNAQIVDLAVPTQNNVTTRNGGGTVATACATSYAAPAAAGAAAVLFGLDPRATPAEVKAALIDSARRTPAWQGRSVSGGVLDLDAAVKLFAQRRGITLVPDATTSTGGGGGGTGSGTGTGTGGAGSTGTGTQGGLVTGNPGTGTGNPSTGTGTAGGPGRDVIAPSLSRLSFSPRLFVMGSGTTIVSRVTEPSVLTLSLQRGERGAIRGGRCVPAGRASSRARRCTRYVTVAPVHIRVPAGTARTPWNGRADDGTALGLGRYRVSATATDAAGNLSRAKRRSFTVIRSR